MTWKTETLGEVVRLRRGFDLPNARRKDGPYPVLSAGQAIGSHNEAMVRGPGFAIGRATNLGRPVWSDEDFWPLNTTLFAEDFMGNDPRWVFHLFESLDLSGFDSGSVQPMLNRNYISNVPVLVPSLQVQQAIAEVLGALDDKIAANHRTMSTGESLSDALFSLACQATTTTVPANTYFDLSYGKGLPSSERKSGTVPVYGSGGVVGRHESPLFKGPGVIVGRKGSVGTVYWAEKGAFPIDTTFFVQECSFPLPFVYLLLKHMNLPLMVSDSAVPGLNRTRVLQEAVPAMSHAETTSLAAQVTPLFTNNYQLEKENISLVRTRDELLPALMSGRITVRDAEKRVEKEV